MKNICVYCGSSPGRQPIYVAAAKALGRTLVENNIGLVYGGASVGTMGVIADAVLAAGGEAIGIIPKVLQRKEVVHEGLTKLHLVESMHERKALMAELSDGFIALPGGFGTLEEIFEIITWAQLGMHQKPVGLLNIDGYYDQLTAFLQHTVDEQFVRSTQLEAVLVADKAADLLARMKSYQPMDTKRWIEKENI